MDLVSLILISMTTWKLQQFKGFHDVISNMTSSAFFSRDSYSLRYKYQVWKKKFWLVWCVAYAEWPDALLLGEKSRWNFAFSPSLFGIRLAINNLDSQSETSKQRGAWIREKPERRATGIELQKAKPLSWMNESWLIYASDKRLLNNENPLKRSQQINRSQHYLDNSFSSNIAVWDIFLARQTS